ncbi:MAG: hypothetical protein U9Q15_05585 [Patescibacteria group bacterium]|nr:hypothetical protein [Patescibacteria group bacterium]
MYLVLFSLLLVATDLWSKSYFPTLVHNTGVSFGMQLSQWIIASIYILAAGYLLATVFVQDK